MLGSYLGMANFWRTSNLNAAPLYIPDVGNLRLQVARKYNIILFLVM